MIVSGPGVAATVADAGRVSLDKEVNKLREDGRLGAGEKNMEKLKWTTETLKAAREFEKVYCAQSPLHLSWTVLTTHYSLLTLRSLSPLELRTP